MLVLRYALTAEDHFQFNYYRFWESKDAAKRKQKAYLNTILTVFFGGLAMHFLLGIPFDHFAMAVYVLFGFCLVLFLPALFRRKLRKNVNRLLSEPGNKTHTSSNEVTISDSGIVKKDQFSEARYEWNAITRQEENENYYFLYLNSIQVILVPKRAMNQDEQKLFNEYLLRYVPLEATFSRI